MKNPDRVNSVASPFKIYSPFREHPPTSLVARIRRGGKSAEDGPEIPIDYSAYKMKAVSWEDATRDVDGEGNMGIYGGLAGQAAGIALSAFSDHIGGSKRRILLAMNVSMATASH